MIIVILRLTYCQWLQCHHVCDTYWLLTPAPRPKLGQGTFGSLGIMDISGSGRAGGALNQAQKILFGQGSLEERFGKLSGRELQNAIFETYAALWLDLVHSLVDDHDCETTWESLNRYIYIYLWNYSSSIQKRMNTIHKIIQSRKMNVQTDPRWNLQVKSFHFNSFPSVAVQVKAQKRTVRIVRNT